MEVWRDNLRDLLGCRANVIDAMCAGSGWGSDGAVEDGDGDVSSISMAMVMLLKGRVRRAKKVCKKVGR